MDLDESLPKVTVDANQIQQVFINLMVNALDAIGENSGTIKVTSKAITVCAKGPFRSSAPCAASGMTWLTGRSRSMANPPSACASAKRTYRAHPPQSHVRLARASPGRHAPLEEGVDSCARTARARSWPKVSLSRNAAPDLCFRSSPERDSSRAVCGMAAAGIAGNRSIPNWNDEFVEVRVEDDGCGIPKTQIPKLFEPFATTKGQKGTGWAWPLPGESWTTTMERSQWKARSVSGQALSSGFR